MLLVEAVGPPLEVLVTAWAVLKSSMVTTTVAGEVWLSKVKATPRARALTNVCWGLVFIVVQSVI